MNFRCEGKTYRLDWDEDLIALLTAAKEEHTPAEREAAVRAVLARLPVVVDSKAA